LLPNESAVDSGRLAVDRKGPQLTVHRPQSIVFRT